MKKTNIYNGEIIYPRVRKLLRIMKLTCFLILFGFMQVAASTYAQQTKLTIKLKNASLSTVLEEIEETSEFRFFYDSNEIDLSSEVTLSKKNSNIKEVLNSVFFGTNYEYEIVDRHIILRSDIGKTR